MVALQFKEHCAILVAIFETALAGLFGAMRAAKNFAAGFDAVSDHFALTMWTGRRQHVNGALETVEGTSFSGRRNLKRLVIVVPTNVTSRHNLISCENVAAVATSGQKSRVPTGIVGRFCETPSSLGV